MRGNNATVVSLSFQTRQYSSFIYIILWKTVKKRLACTHCDWNEICAYIVRDCRYSTVLLRITIKNAYFIKKKSIFLFHSFIVCCQFCFWSFTNSFVLIFLRLTLLRYKDKSQLTWQIHWNDRVQFTDRTCLSALARFILLISVLRACCLRRVYITSHAWNEAQSASYSLVAAACRSWRKRDAGGNRSRNSTSL